MSLNSKKGNAVCDALGVALTKGFSTCEEGCKEIFSAPCDHMEMGIG